jgi:hypothetical protein
MLSGRPLGCDTAQRAAITAPERFRRVVLMIPPGRIAGFLTR